MEDLKTVLLFKLVVNLLAFLSLEFAYLLGMERFLYLLIALFHLVI